MGTDVVPDHTCHVIAREDDYFFGVLQCRVHEVWSLSQGAWMGVGNDPRYTSARTFETFPFPWAPGQEPKDSPLVEAIAAGRARIGREARCVAQSARCERGRTQETHAHQSVQRRAPHGWWMRTASWMRPCSPLMAGPLRSRIAKS